MANLAMVLKTEATRLGFDQCRITPLRPVPQADFVEQWLALGRAGEMKYLERHGEKRRDPSLLVEPGSPPLRSLIALAVNYHQVDLPPALRDDPSRGVIASYAWGDDYHEIIRPLLYELDAFLRHHTGRATRGKCLVDTGPVLERAWAERAGLGFTGKNCCTIHPTAGSWLFLATILVPEVLPYDAAPIPLRPVPLRPVDVPLSALLEGLPPAEDYGSWQLPAADAAEPSKVGTCGRCTRCLTACPTDAFVGPYHLDPQRCISYWTIEAKGAIPRALRRNFANRIFGCDICQEVCPWNGRLPERTPLQAQLVAQADRVAPPLLAGFAAENPYWLDDTVFRTHFVRSPILRAGRRGMLRNVCVALGNWADPQVVDPVARALQDPEAVVRAHAAWALGEIVRRHELETARTLLYAQLAAEAVEAVREELAAALQGNPETLAA